MKHYGDITQLSGYDLPVVDVIVGGSPCQDLSVAGKRAGLDGERSGLFMEQIRIVKEMREKDVRNGRTNEFCRCRYLVWENVPGAFSSSGKGAEKGSDFQAVLEEIVKIVCKEAPPVPIPKEGWPKAGCISGVGDSGCPFSVAWRVHDAQFWGPTLCADGRMLERGTPQRRKRIALVADFGGLSAPEILFVRKGMHGNFEQSEEEGKGIADGTERSTGETGFYDAYQHHGWRRSDISDPMTVGQNNTIRGDTPLVQDPIAFHLTQDPISSTERSPCVSSGNPHNGQSSVGVLTLKEPIPLEGNGSRESHKGSGYGESGDPCFTLNSIEQHGIAILSNTVSAFGIGSYSSNAMKSKNPHSGIYKADTARTLDLNGGSPACDQGGMAIVHAVDCRNGTEDECVNGTLQSKEQGYNTNSNNVVRVSWS